MTDWFERNSVSREPPDPEARAEWLTLAVSTREWHPGYDVGDRVRRVVLSGLERGEVTGFEWRGTHLFALVRYASGRVEASTASTYCKGDGR